MDVHGGKIDKHRKWKVKHDTLINYKIKQETETSKPKTKTMTNG